MASDNLLEYLSYSSLVDHYDELLVSNYWTIKISKWPAAAYHPNEELIKLRIQSITNIPEPEATMLDYNVRGFPAYQTGQTSVPIGDITMNFLDYEDSSILFFARSWRDAQHYWEKFVANRLEYCVAEMTIYRTNKEGKAVRKYNLKRCLINNINYPEDFTAESQLIGDNVSIGIKCLVRPEMLNYNA